MTGRYGSPPGNCSEGSHLRTTYRYILQAFPRLGRAPSVLEIEQELQLTKNVIADILKSLTVEGALRYDPTTQRIVDAYPYSAVPTRYGVIFENGKHAYCTSAVEAFCVPFLTKSDVTIHSRCSQCQLHIRIGVTGFTLGLAEPTTAMIWESAAPHDWPKTNFFCCEAHLLDWRANAPGKTGQACSLGTALDRGHKAAGRIRQSAGL